MFNKCWTLFFFNNPWCHVFLTLNGQCAMQVRMCHAMLGGLACCSISNQWWWVQHFFFFNNLWRHFFLTSLIFFNKFSASVQPLFFNNPWCCSHVLLQSQVWLWNYEQAKLSQHGFLETPPILPWEHSPPILPWAAQKAIKMANDSLWMFIPKFMPPKV